MKTINKKNAVFFANKKPQVIFIYHEYDNSLFQIGTLKENETTVLNIPPNSYIMVKRGHLIGDFMVPIETIVESHVTQNHYQL